ncbi:MAG TPA: hypothetical protein VFO76_07690 [Candidatus Kapabacteria bacterium]|nr:hypothetical protein [Candidatus Kapabacteria bacterium]
MEIFFSNKITYAAVNKIINLVAFYSLLLTSSVSFAQGFGIEAGINYDLQGGHFIAPCGCTFADGTGLGFLGNLSYDLLPFSDFTVGLAAGVHYNHVTDVEVTPTSTERILNGDQQATNLTYVSFAPYLRYTVPSTSISVTLSPEIGYLLSSSFQHISGSTLEEPEPNSDASIYIRSFRIGARFSAGYNLQFDKTIIAPTLSCNLPLNTLRSNGTDVDWKILSFSGSIMVRFAL